MTQDADRKDNRLGPARRLKRREEISALFADGRRGHDRYLTLIARPNRRSHSRMGVAVSRRHGNAVVRNRLKRLCREAFRLERRHLPSGIDYVLLPRRGVEPSVEKLRASLRTLATRLADEEAGS